LLKRKRRTGLNISTGFRTTLTPPRTPPIGSLVDYGDEDDDLDGLSSANDFPGSPGHDSGLPKRSPSPNLLSSPRLSNRQVSPSVPPQRPSPDDDEDSLLEALVRGKNHKPSPPIATPKVPDLGIGPVRLTGKRQREDDDDELLERLASKTKRPDLGAERVLSGMGGRAGSKPGDDPPKKIKLKFGLTSLGAAASPYVPPSEAGAKDGDTG
jgi:protein phosphatase-4 regulatory subunit 3